MCEPFNFRRESDKERPWRKATDRLFFFGSFLVTKQAKVGAVVLSSAEEHLSAHRAAFHRSLLAARIRMRLPFLCITTHPLHFSYSSDTSFFCWGLGAKKKRSAFVRSLCCGGSALCASGCGHELFLTCHLRGLNPGLSLVRRVRRNSPYWRLRKPKNRRR